MLIHTKNGLDIEAIYLCTISDTNGRESKVFYAQERLVECDKDNKEILSHDIISLFMGLPAK